MAKLQDVMADLQATQPVSKRMRAIFGLKAIPKEESRKALEASLKTDPSILIRHEVAYVLGQMQSQASIPALQETLCNLSEDAMVRHEAGEALGAIGDASAIPVLMKYANDPETVQEVRETCVLALENLRAHDETGNDKTKASTLPYKTVDPAPPTSDEKDVATLRDLLCDATKPLFERYRALFALRNHGSDDAVLALCEGMETESESALFRHEVAYVLGQMASPVSVDSLAHVLRRSDESDMVRHEAAEALGAVGTPEAEKVLEEFRRDGADVVRESVEIALDIADYVNSVDLHYARTLPKEAVSSGPSN